MTRIEVLERLSKVMQDVFDDESIVAHENMTAAEVDGWDSLMNITFISEMEAEFDIALEMRDVTNIKRISDLVDRILELKK